MFSFFFYNLAIIFQFNVALFLKRHANVESPFTEEEIKLADYYEEHDITDPRPDEYKTKGLLLDDNLFHGDLIDFDENTVRMLEKPKGSYTSASFLKQSKWPDAVVPYVISEKFSPMMKANILVSMRAIERVTCVRFVPNSAYDEEFPITPVDITLPDPPSKAICASSVGRNGSTYVYMQLHDPGCSPRATIMHEFMHILGFVHEQCRADRDDFLTINWDNVKPGKERNFIKFNYPYKTYTPYDYSSLLHYPKYAFSVEEYVRKTMIPLDENADIGNAQTFSRFDIIKMNRHYECGEEFPECQDKLERRICEEKGLGLGYDKRRYPDRAKCIDRNWAMEYCQKTCGECYIYFHKYENSKHRV